MAIIKDISIDIIKKMPEECSVDDIMYELNFISKVLEGVKDADEGRYISKEELNKRINSWASSGLTGR
ncbi:MAG: hypothetical protein A2X61_08915 [Ignavibacteria bacterium GWB2_35_12]|nr:MAG: hypothetical protein A2X63_04305 [Ignavibacteria bacterium GWA2_35_8]OGU40612.1 MAG: hypothetical protein A2X61_08915 [Ignavibacteria bacterium GWB2_35_12]OGU91676.1 MAG: hypothetical protein A2220_10565 [Ignavibacteria bacterium RIFOXYA2_FULL_35_10]OGV22646.1 MAG: hypothetical protein A2475_13110 [Ignavibacteria bacterium RIFOXYC2_FULL_35_21]